MAEATVALTPSDTGYVGRGVWASTGAAQQTVTNNVRSDVANLLPNRAGYTLSIFYFSSIADTNTWTSGIRNVVACAFQPEDATDDDVRAAVTSQGTDGSGAVFTFVASDTRAGWLWVLHGS